MNKNNAQIHGKNKGQTIIIIIFLGLGVEIIVR